MRGVMPKLILLFLVMLVNNPQVLVTFMVLTKWDPNILVTENYSPVRRLGRIAGVMKEFIALQKLPQSPLMPLILNPNNLNKIKNHYNVEILSNSVSFLCTFFFCYFLFLVDFTLTQANMSKIIKLNQKYDSKFNIVSRVSYDKRLKIHV